MATQYPTRNLLAEEGNPNVDVEEVANEEMESDVECSLEVGVIQRFLYIPRTNED